MRVVAVDPGVNGALALLVNGRLTELLDMPTRKDRLSDGQRRTRIDTQKLGSWLGDRAPDAIFLEQVNAMPGEGPTGAFAFGRSVGAIEGAAGAIGIQTTLVPAQTWQRAIGLRRGQDGTKTASRSKATKLFPEMAAAFKRVKDDGRADAALIGLFGHNLLTNL